MNQWSLDALHGWQYNVVEVMRMSRQELVDKLSIYIPQSKAQQEPIDRLHKLAEKRDGSINYLVVGAIIQYLDREAEQ